MDQTRLEKYPLGRTGLMVSPLGLGTVKFGRNQGIRYPQAFDIPDENELADFLALARGLGINLLDTAPAYGMSEERLGRLLKGQRQEWVIAGKAGEDFQDGKSTYNFTPDHFQRSLERSLARLQTDYLDVLLVHSDGRDAEILNDEALIRKLHEFKDQGLVRAVGASTKTVEGGLKALELMDVVMATYNPSYVEEKPVLDLADQINKGVLLKKALASGHMKGSVQESLSFVFDHPGVNSVVVGTIDPDHLKENARAVYEIFKNRGKSPNRD
ncbi:MAG: aldo/keto reductase [Alphaproteobacteria bacterium]|nr:aldo/keto reductase [Alphaproteobacteria bacterium]